MSVVKATTVRPFLMFTGKAEEAMNFYVSLFSSSKIQEVKRHGAGAPVAEGKIERAVFSLHGQEIMCSDSPDVHNFTFTPSVSMFVTVGTDEEIDKCFAALAVDGKELMPLGDYGFSKKFGWVQDRFGVSWQLNLQA